MRSESGILVILLLLLTAVPPPPAAAQPGPAGRPTLVLVNKSGQPIDELYISSTRTAGWGEDRLGVRTVERNGTFRLRLTDGCLYDLQVAYRDKRTEERMRVNLCRTPTQAFTGAEAHAPPKVPSHGFTLENHTSKPITALSLAEASDPAGGEDWGDNLLDAPLRPGETTAVTFEGDCSMGVRVLFANGAAEQIRATDLCTEAKVLTVTPGWTTQDDLPPAEPAESLSVVNRSTHRLVELFIHPDDAADGDERLGPKMLDPGATLPLALQRDGKCLFTVRSVFEGDVPDQVQHGMDFCPRRTVDVGTP